MKTPHLKSALSCALIAAALAAGGWHSATFAQPAPPARQSTVQGAVTVSVTPKQLGASEWQFAVVLDTHAAENLGDDLLAAAVLVVDGRAVQPIAWEGAGPGGHHREGVLRFPAPGGNPGAVELRIQRQGEASPRVFRWQGAALR